MMQCYLFHKQAKNPYAFFDFHYFHLFSFLTTSIQTLICNNNLTFHSFYHYIVMDKQIIIQRKEKPNAAARYFFVSKEAK